jgi:hypothetical protein
MISNLSDRDKKILKIGAVAAGIIIVYSIIICPFFESWSQVRSEIRLERAKITVLSGVKGPQAAIQRASLFSTVPVVEIPETENLHRIHFAGRLHTQLSSAGVRIKSLQYLSGEKFKPEIGLKQQRLQCRGNCSFGQVLDLLSVLGQNPYLVGIEDLQLTTDTKNPQDMEMVLTVSTFVK